MAIFKINKKLLKNDKLIKKKTLVFENLDQASGPQFTTSPFSLKDSISKRNLPFLKRTNYSL